MCSDFRLFDALSFLGFSCFFLFTSKRLLLVRDSYFLLSDLLSIFGLYWFTFWKGGFCLVWLIVLEKIATMEFVFEFIRLLLKVLMWGNDMFGSVCCVLVWSFSLLYSNLKLVCELAGLGRPL